MAWLCFDSAHSRGTTWFYLELVAFVALQAMAAMAIVLNVCLREVLERSGALGKRRGKKSRRRRGAGSSASSRGGGAGDEALCLSVSLCLPIGQCVCLPVSRLLLPERRLCIDCLTIALYTAKVGGEGKSMPPVGPLFGEGYGHQQQQLCLAIFQYVCKVSSWIVFLEDRTSGLGSFGLRSHVSWSVYIVWR